MQILILKIQNRIDFLVVRRVGFSIFDSPGQRDYLVDVDLEVYDDLYLSNLHIN